MLTAHRTFFLGVFLLGDSAAGDRDLQRGDGMERLTEGELDRTAYLSKCRAFHHVVAGGQHAAESADIEELPAEPVLGPFGVGLSCNAAFVLGSFDGDLLGAFNDGTLFNKDIVAVGRVIFACRREQIDHVAYLPLEAHVRDNAAVGVGIETRQVAGIGIAIRVAVGDFEQEEEVVAVRQDVVAHILFVSGSIGFGFGVIPLVASGLSGSPFRSLLLVETEGKAALGLEVKSTGEAGRLT